MCAVRRARATIWREAHSRSRSPGRRPHAVWEARSKFQQASPERSPVKAPSQLRPYTSLSPAASDPAVSAPPTQVHALRGDGVPGHSPRHSATRQSVDRTTPDLKPLLSPANGASHRSSVDSQRRRSLVGRTGSEGHPAAEGMHAPSPSANFMRSVPKGLPPRLSLSGNSYSSSNTSISNNSVRLMAEPSVRAPPLARTVWRPASVGDVRGKAAERC